MDSQNPNLDTSNSNVFVSDLGEISRILDLDVVINKEMSPMSSWDCLVENPVIENIKTPHFGKGDKCIAEYAKNSASYHQESLISPKPKKAFFDVIDGLSLDMLATS